MPVNSFAAIRPDEDGGIAACPVRDNDNPTVYIKKLVRVGENAYQYCYEAVRLFGVVAKALEYAFG